MELAKYKGHSLIGEVLPAEAEARLLILHGAGKSNRGRTRQARQLLAEGGVSNCGFDLIGHGDTGGDLEGWSLIDRYEQAMAVYKNLSVSGPIALLGSSMGADTALRLSETIETDVLILVAPAVYAAEARDVPFGPEFTEIIHRPDSWQSSEMLPVLERFTGRLLLIVAGDDARIPEELPKRLFDIAEQAQTRELLVVPGSPHAIWPFLDEHTDEQRQVVEAILRTVR
jgi:pimeloyl-ACP methyl ester carboxylesterase